MCCLLPDVALGREVGREYHYLLSMHAQPLLQHTRPRWWGRYGAGYPAMGEDLIMCASMCHVCLAGGCACANCNHYASNPGSLSHWRPSHIPLCMAYRIPHTASRLLCHVCKLVCSKQDIRCVAGRSHLCCGSGCECHAGHPLEHRPQVRQAPVCWPAHQHATAQLSTTQVVDWCALRARSAGQVHLRDLTLGADTSKPQHTIMCRVVVEKMPSLLDLTSQAEHTNRIATKRARRPMRAAVHTYDDDGLVS